MNTHSTSKYPSYLVMVIKAILSSSDKRLLLQEIYAYIKNNYSHIIDNHVSWQNSVRHNLSNHGCFYKMRNLNHGASFWGIFPQYIPFFEKGDFSRRWLTGPKRRQQNQPIYPIGYQDSSAQCYSRQTPYHSEDYYGNMAARTDPHHAQTFSYYLPNGTFPYTNGNMPGMILGIPPPDVLNAVTSPSPAFFLTPQSQTNTNSNVRYLQR